MNRFFATFFGVKQRKPIDIRKVAASTVSRHKEALRILAEYDRT